MSKLIYLVPLFPLAGFLLNGLGRNLLSRKLVSVIAVGAVLASFVMSLLIFREVGAADFQTQVVKLFDFIKVGKVDIPFSFQVDRLSVLFLLIITGVGTLIHLHPPIVGGRHVSRRYRIRRERGRCPHRAQELHPFSARTSSP